MLIWEELVRGKGYFARNMEISGWSTFEKGKFYIKYFNMSTTTTTFTTIVINTEIDDFFKKILIY